MSAFVFVNRFRVHADPEGFETAFAESSAFMTEMAGYRRHRLVRVRNDDEPQYLNIAAWDDEAAMRRAVADPRFEPHLQALQERASSEPLLCQVVQDYT